MSPYGSARLRGVWRLIYAHNPFYLISACLVLAGCQMSFDMVDEGGRVSWLLMATLVGYTVVLAGVACFIVRSAAFGTTPACCFWCSCCYLWRWRPASIGSSS